MNDFFCIDRRLFDKYVLLRSANAPTRFSVEQIEAIKANVDAWANKEFVSKNLRIDGSTAIIPVVGTLIPSASFADVYFAEVFGEAFTTYPAIAMQTQIAEQNPLVEKVKYVFNTPGGYVRGVEDAALAIATCTKPTEGVVDEMAASAGYWLISQTEKITAMGANAQVGSIGVVVDLMDATALYEKIGLKPYSITSTEAPNKRLTPHSDEYKTEMVAQLDHLHSSFASAVAEGRARATGKKIDEAYVNENFGRGGMLFAKAAMSSGMVDEVFEKKRKSEKPTEGKMDESQVVALKESARQEGINQERARVEALLPWMKIDGSRIEAAIKSGDSMSAELMTELSTKAAANAVPTRVEAAIAARQEDAPPVVLAPETQGVSEEDRKAQELYENAMAKSKIKGK